MRLKGLFFVLLIFFICISPTKCQDDDEEDEDQYDEEGETESTTTRRYRVRSSTVSATDSGRNDTQAQSATATSVPLAATAAAASSSSSAATQAPVAPPVTQAARVTVRTTTISDYEDEEGTTEEEGYGYIFRPLNSLVDNIVAGNVTGIVDNALSIRTPPEIRAFVNNVMSNVFNAGVGSALRQFMPSIFSTRAPPTSSPSRDPIPTQASKKNAEPLAAIVQGFEGRTNDSEANAPAEKKKMEVSFAGHPGSPASRLKCEIIS